MDMVDMYCIGEKYGLSDGYGIIGIEILKNDLDMFDMNTFSTNSINNSLSPDKKNLNIGVNMNKTNRSGGENQFKISQNDNLANINSKNVEIKGKNFNILNNIYFILDINNNNNNNFDFDKKEMKFSDEINNNINNNIIELPEVREDDENNSDYDFDKESSEFISGRIDKDGKEINEVADEFFYDDKKKSSTTTNNKEAKRPDTAKYKSSV
jgi:hypothetical protein